MNKKTNPNNFPPGYTQKDEDRHQRILRNIRVFGVISKILFPGVGLFGVYLFVTAPSATTYERVPNDTPLRINK